MKISGFIVIVTYRPCVNYSFADKIIRVSLNLFKKKYRTVYKHIQIFTFLSHIFLENKILVSSFYGNFKSKNRNRSYETTLILHDLAIVMPLETIIISVCIRIHKNILKYNNICKLM